MKFLAAILLVIAAVSCEPPVYNPRYSSVSYQRFEQAPVETFRSVPQYVLPARLEAPPVFYVKPVQKNATENEQPTTEQPRSVENATTEREAENIESEARKVQSEKLSEEDSFVEQGTYYIYHPTGLLQRIVYATKSDVQNMGYTAQLKYEDVQPIKDPIYTYDPETYALKQVVV